jgi:hypothetical protein
MGVERRVEIVRSQHRALDKKLKIGEGAASHLAKNGRLTMLTFSDYLYFSVLDITTA